MGIAEIDKYAIKSYEAMFGKTRNYGDISVINKLDYADFWTYSFPCFVEGTMVLTSKGFKPIETITIQDEVLTHNNRFKKVVKPMINKTNELIKVDVMSSDPLLTTKNHPFYIRERSRQNIGGKNTRLFSEPKWLPAKDLTNHHYVGVAINQESKLPEWNGSVFRWSDGRCDRRSRVLENVFEYQNFWWLIGRYIGDGWIRSSGGIIICCNKEELNEIIPKIESLNFGYSIVEEKSAYNIHIGFKEIGEYCEQFGRGASNKRLTCDILDLPKELLSSFLEGYMSADGCYTQGLYKATSVSKELIYGIGQCIAKVYDRPFSVYKTKRPRKTIIDGRLVNQKDTYTVSFKKDRGKQDKAFYENGYIWSPVNKIETIDLEDDCFVYNFEVEGDNSYVVQNIIVHNCQDISVSGKQAGINENTRSGLLYQVERLLNIAKERGELPKYLMLENVKNLVGKKFKNQFDEWLKYLEELGYNNYWQVLNAKNYGIPQNRERVFVISIRKDVDDRGFTFPEKFDNGLRLKDLLEENVDEKYYLRQELQDKFKEQFLEELQLSETTGIHVERKGNEIGGTTDICSTLMARDYKGFGNQRMTGVAELQLGENKINVVGDTGDNYEQNGRVYGIDGIAPTLSARDYKDPKRILENNLQQIGTLKGCGLPFDKMHDQVGRVYSAEGVCPTIAAHSGGHLESKIIEAPCVVASRGRNPNNPSNNTTGTPTEQRFEINTQGTSNCLTSVQKDNYVVEPKVVIGSTQKNAYIGDGSISSTLTSAMGDGGGHVPMVGYNNYRIRKLTPRECWRLMGFDDSDFDKAVAVNSNTQLYRQAGNSIVVNVLYYIFKNTFSNYINTENQNTEVNIIQLPITLSSLAV